MDLTADQREALAYLTLRDNCPSGLAWSIHAVGRTYTVLIAQRGGAYVRGEGTTLEEAAFTALRQAATDDGRSQ